MTKKTRAKARRALLTLSLVLVVAVAAVGGTLAWLRDSTDTVTNTFTATNIDIELTETPNTDTNDDKVNDAWTAELIPGKTHTKDPKVTVARPATNVDIYLFVEYDPTTSKTYLDYDEDWTGWTPLTGATDNKVWYRIVGKDDTTTEWSLIEDNKVTVKSDLDKSVTSAALDVTMTFTAYACQLAKNETTNFTPTEAWAIAKPVSQ